jgi:hexosaminidase
MRCILYFPFFTSIIAAIWPLPISYEHGDTILFIKKDVPFYWYEEAGARNAGSTTNKAPFILVSYSYTNNDNITLHLQKRYISPSWSSDAP